MNNNSPLTKDQMARVEKLIDEINQRPSLHRAGLAGKFSETEWRALSASLDSSLHYHAGYSGEMTRGEREHAKNRSFLRDNYRMVRRTLREIRPKSA